MDLNRLMSLCLGVAMSSVSSVGAEPVRASGDVPGAGQTAGAPLSVQITFYGEHEGARPIPLELVEGRILFEVVLAGKPAWALLDNRSERSIIDTGFARAAGFEAGAPDGTFQSPLGEVSKRRVSNVPFTVSHQLEMVAPGLAAVDLKPLTAVYSREIAFVLGQDYLRLMALMVESTTLTLRIGATGRVKIPSTLSPVEIRPDNHRVQGEIFGKQLSMTIDLGFDGVLRVTPQAWASLNSAAGGGAISGHFGKARVAEVTIGLLTAKSVPIEIAALPAADGDAILGMGFFKQSNFLLDVSAGKLWIRPAPRSGEPKTL